MKSIKRDRSGVAARIMIVVVVFVALMVILAVILLAPPKALQTTIKVIDTDGQLHTIYDDTKTLSVVAVGGIQVSAILYATDFTASSPNYKQYTLVKSSSLVLATPLASGVIPAPTGTGYGVQLWTSTRVDGLPVVKLCQSLANAIVPASFTATLNIGTKYGLGSTVYGSASGNTVSITASAIISAASAGGCPGNGSYELTYIVQLTAQAVGTGTLPTSTYFGYWNVAIEIATGSITLTGTISSSTQMVDPGLVLGGA